MQTLNNLQRVKRLTKSSDCTHLDQTILDHRIDYFPYCKCIPDSGKTSQNHRCGNFILHEVQQRLPSSIQISR